MALPEWYERYLNALETADAFRDENENLRLEANRDDPDDPFIGVTLGPFGMMAMKRLSEWEDEWTRWAAMLRALGNPSPRPPWEGVVKRYYQMIRVPSASETDKRIEAGADDTDLFR